MPPVPPLPPELWDLVLQTHGPLALARAVGGDATSCAAVRIQRAARTRLLPLLPSSDSVAPMLARVRGTRDAHWKLAHVLRVHSSEWLVRPVHASWLSYVRAANVHVRVVPSAPPVSLSVFLAPLRMRRE